MKQLLEAGVHFGHQTRRWNPKMREYIFAERNGIHIIDLAQTVDRLDAALDFIREVIRRGDSVLFVGTKKQAQEALSSEAERSGQHWVNNRWLGGMLTNFQTVYKRLQRMKELESLDLTGTAQGYTKKETLQLSREKDKLTRTLGGLRDMQKLPAAIWVVDTKKEHIAIAEARKLGIPVVAILDTNCDPDEVDYPIPGNDDAIRAVSTLTRVVADAVAEGLIARAGAAQGEEKPEAAAPGADEPLADWERELLQGQGASGSGQLAETGGAIAETAAPLETSAPEATPGGDAPAQS
jgi:small subunit ribosomal protein S2